MFAVTISWIIISIVFLSFGDFLVTIYNRLCKQNEQYGLTDTFLLGMCFTLIPLSLSSLWLPSNEYILLVYMILCAVYWIVRKERFLSVIRKIKQTLGSKSAFQLIIFIIPVISLMIVILWQVGVFDSLFYHQQNIRWNEEYAAVPGLANLEHRFGFNSNYLLLSAVFSLRFIFGEGVYSLQALVLAFVICWIIKEIIQSGYELKRIMLLFFITGYIFSFGYSLASTSTDAIPNIVSFYLIAKLLLYPDSLKSKSLLFVFVCVSLLTFKLTIIPLCLFALYILIVFIKNKEYKATVFLVIISGAVIALWLTRNVIISGYLIFPFAEIDLFSVDWKVPKYVAVEERDFILSCGIRIFHDIFYIFNLIEIGVTPIKDIISYGAIYLYMIASVVISPLVVLYCFFKKKYLDKRIYLVYLVLVLIMAVWYMGGPDPRFIGGTLFAVMYFVAFLVLSTKREILVRYAGMATITLFAFIMAYWAISRCDRFYHMFGLGIPNEKARPVSEILYRQYPYRELLKSNNSYTDVFKTYKLNENIDIYISYSPEIPHGRYVCFDSPFPCTVMQDDELSKYQDISEIEARGSSLQEGFRPKAK